MSNDGCAVAQAESKPSGWARLGSPLVLAVAAPLIVAGIIAVVRTFTAPDDPVRVNIELILDVSGQMRERFGDSTRFDAAISELIDFVEPRDADNLALWASGGSCGKEGARELVPLGQENSDEIEDALRDLEPRGPANLADAVVGASGAFSDPTRFPAEVQKKLVLVTAGTDTCDPDYIEAIGERLAEVGSELNLKLHFFTLEVPKRLERDLRALQRRLPEQVEVQFAETPAQLADDLAEFEARLPEGPDEANGPTVGPSGSASPG
jgi:hypothetical protein